MAEESKGIVKSLCDEIIAIINKLKADILTKQDTLVSGANIKTVNGQSLVGTGDVTVDVPNIAQNLATPSANVVPSTQAVADESSRITSIIDTKVSKSGDTMTGQLGIKDANIVLGSTKDVVTAIVKTEEDSTQTPTKNYIDAFRVLDKNNKIMSDFRSQRNSTSTLTQMIARKNKADGTTVQADITCSVDAQGNPTSTLNQTAYVNGTVVSNLDNVNFIAKSKSLVKGTTPTDTNKYVGYDWQDKNGQRLAYLGVKYDTAGNKRLELQKLDGNLSEFSIQYAIRNYSAYYLQDTAHTLGNVDVNTWAGNQIQFQDSKGKRLARVQPMYASDGTARLCLAASKGTESESSLVIGSDGYTQCPKPADSSNTNTIATTNWAGGLNRANTWLASNTFRGAIELSPQNNPKHGGYIDFHYNGDTSDYTSRIIESAKGELEFASNTKTSGAATFLAQPKVSINGNARYRSVCTGYTKGTAPTTNQFGGISTTDKNGVEVATLYSNINTDNAVTSALWVKQPTATGNEAKSLSIWCDKNGGFHSYCGVQSSENNSILTIVAHGTNWIKYSDGRLEQWGTCTTADQTITLHQPYKDSNYMITVTLAAGENNNYCAVISTITTTSFHKNDRGQYWHTIGWWK